MINVIFNIETYSHLLILMKEPIRLSESASTWLFRGACEYSCCMGCGKWFRCGNRWALPSTRSWRRGGREKLDKNARLQELVLKTLRCDATTKNKAPVVELPKSALVVSSMGSFNAEVPVDYIGHRYLINALEQNGIAWFLLVTSLGCGGFMAVPIWTLEERVWCRGS